MLPNRRVMYITYVFPIFLVIQASLSRSRLSLFATSTPCARLPPSHIYIEIAYIHRHYCASTARCSDLFFPIFCSQASPSLLCPFITILFVFFPVNPSSHTTHTVRVFLFFRLPSARGDCPLLPRAHHAHARRPLIYT